MADCQQHAKPGIAMQAKVWYSAEVIMTYEKGPDGDGSWPFVVKDERGCQNIKTKIQAEFG